MLRRPIESTYHIGLAFVLDVRAGMQSELPSRTPETVHPNKPVEYFGKEASAFTRKRLEGKTVRLERDPTGDTRDKYGRLLRHVYVDSGTHFNALLISKGYTHAYTRFPFSQMEEFRKLEPVKLGEGCGATTQGQ